MAVVEEKVEKAGRADRVEKPTKPENDDDRPAGGGLGGAIGWVPRKLGEGRSFLSEVRTELKKVTWPSRKEVYSTTIVVIATSIFFGFYLWGLDLALSRVLSIALKR
jgi:preprotein translocase subunit SecE